MARLYDVRTLIHPLHLKSIDGPDYTGEIGVDPSVIVKLRLKHGFAAEDVLSWLGELKVIKDTYGGPNGQRLLKVSGIIDGKRQSFCMALADIGHGNYKLITFFNAAF